MAIRALLPALLLSCAALLAGCADSLDTNAITVKQVNEVESASGPDGNTGECDGDGILSYTLARRAGTVRILVADEDGQILHETGEMDAAPDGFDSEQAVKVNGAPGVWTVSVERTAFTGSYTVSIAC